MTFNEAYKVLKEEIDNTLEGAPSMARIHVLSIALMEAVESENNIEFVQ